MHRLYVLGRLDLFDADGAEVQSVLAQPRRLALLAYLAVTSSNGASRRDKLLGVFWPELTQERARQALNKAVHYLRQTLGEGAIVSRTAEDVLLDPGRVWCDAAAFADAVHGERLSEALESYRGDLLPSFYIEDAPEFEAWADAERVRLRRLAGRAAHSLAQRREREGQFTTAIGLARRAVELEREDERAVRQLLGLLDRLGDRAGALGAYEEFARRMATEFGAEPAAETKTLIERVRARSEPVSNALQADAERLGPREDLTAVAPPRKWVVMVGAVAAMIGGLLTLALLRQPAYVKDRVVVTPLENGTQDPAIDTLGHELLASLPDAIAREGVAEPVPAAAERDLVARASGSPGEVGQWMARETRAGLELRGACFGGSAFTTCQVDLLRMPGNVLRMSVSVTGDPRQPAFVEQLTERLLVVLFLQHTWGDRVTWLGEYIPSSLGAVRAFKDAWDRAEWQYLAEAIRLDTGWVGAAAWSAPDSSKSVAESLLARMARRPGLLDGEREVVRYTLAGIRRDAEEGFQLAMRRFRVNPELWVGLATYWAQVTGRAATAISVSTYADSLVDVSHRRILNSKTRRGYALHQLGRYQDQLELAHELERRFPNDVLIYRTEELMALAALGQADSVRARLAKWEATPEPADRDYTGSRAYIAGLELMAHGMVSEGREVLARTLPLYRRLRKGGEYHSELVEILTVTGQLEEAWATALADLRSMKTPDDSMGVFIALGAIAARQGRLDDALHYDRLLTAAAQHAAARFDGLRVGAEKRARLAGDLAYGRALLAGYRDDRESAVRFLEEAQRYGQAEHRFVHREPALIGMLEYPPLQELLKPRP